MNEEIEKFIDDYIDMPLNSESEKILLRVFWNQIKSKLSNTVQETKEHKSYAVLTLEESAAIPCCKTCGQVIK